MSACSDFAEHVWKPGSCKNCFHPFSAHRRSTARGPAGGLPAVCLTRTSLGGGDEEPGVTSPSPYSKPTIAVKPTMMMNSNDANEAMTDVNMNGGQENQKSTVERLDLKKLLDLSPLYIDGCANGLRTALLQSPGSKTECTNYYTPVPHAPMSPMGQSTAAKHSNTSSIFVFQEAGRSLKENGNTETFRQLSSSTTTTSIATKRTTKSTYKGNGGVGLGKAASREPCGPSAGIPLSPSAGIPLSPSAGIPLSTETIPSRPAAVLNHRVNTVSPVTLTAEPSSTSPSSSSPALTLDSFTHNAPASFHSPPSVSEPASVSDSSCSYYSSTDSLPGPERTPGGRISSPEHPQSPLTPTSPRSSPATPSGQTDTEPIYAESTKKKRRNQSNGIHAQTTAKLNNQAQRSAQSEQPSAEGQRATISVVAAHTEENNRTFFLTSPDSAVSTQCHFSPKALKDPASPAFSWPSPGHSSQSLGSPVDPSGHASPLPHHKPQSSPPIPPKRNIRSPKLGASSLSPSSCSPVPLPDLPALSLLSPKESPPNGAGAADRRHKLTQHGSAWNCRILEEEEEEEGERRDRDAKREAVKSASTSRLVGMANTAAVWREARDWRSQGNLPPAVIGTGTAQAQPPTSPNNGVSQGQREATGAGEDAGHTWSMLAKASLLAASTELLLGVGKKAASHETNTAPPPPPPKKHHRVCGRLSGSSMELEHSASSQPGSVESLTQSLRGGLGSPTLPSASTDSLAGDATGSRDLSRRTCSSPFARSPLASNPGSPQPDPPFSFAHNTPPPLPEKKLVNRTVSAPDSAGTKPFVRAYPRLPFTGSETNVCQSAADPGPLGPAGPLGSVSQSSLPSSPLDPRGPLLFSSSESLERCHAAAAPSARTSRSRTLDEPPPPLKARGGGRAGGGGGRLGVHPRGSVTCSSSPQLSTAPQSAPGTGPAAGSCMQLQTLLSNMDSREGVYSKLGGLYAESLRRLALKCEDHFTCSQRSPLRFDESNWSLFKLTCNRPSCSSGDAVYYSAACASDTSNLYAVKICKGPSAEARQAPLYGLSVQQSMPPHFNVQRDCGHFNACVPQSMLPADEAPGPQQQADPERVVVITREVPRQSAADFAREWEAFHRAQPEAYERRVCFLLLQLCSGLEHLKESGVTHRDLCLENLLLVPHHRHQPPPLSPGPSEGAASGGTPPDSQRHLPRLLISNFAKAKRRSAEDAASAGADPRLKRDHARLAPEIVSAAQYRKFDEFQTGILIYELLHQANPFEVSPALKEQDYRCHDLPPIPTLSLYSAGLHRLAQLLLQPDPIKRIHIQEAKRVLQSLLWGPRRDLMEQPWERPRPGGGGGGGGAAGDGARHEGLLNWLDVKRALLMMKFAERSLEPERNAELEDWLCCQYFSSAHPLSLCHTAELLYCLK